MLRIIAVALGTAAVTVAERAPHVAHGSERTQIVVGLIFGVPFAALALYLEYRHRNPGPRRKKAAPRRTSPYSYPFGGQR